MKILEKYTLPCDILHARKSSLISLIAKASGKGTAASEKIYEKLIKAANDATVFGHSLESNRTLIRMYNLSRNWTSNVNCFLIQLRTLQKKIH